MALMLVTLKSFLLNRRFFTQRIFGFLLKLKVRFFKLLFEISIDRDI